MSAESHDKLRIWLLEGGREQDDPHSWIWISIIIGKHMQMFRFKFQQNRTINEQFNFLRGGGGEAPGGKGALFINFYLNYY